MAVKPTIKIPTAKIEGKANEAIMADRLRVSAILESPEGMARPRIAQQLALRSNMDATSALELLRSTPVDNPYVAAMDALGPVNIESFATAAPSSVEGKRAKRREEIQRNVNPKKGV